MPTEHGHEFGSLAFAANEAAQQDREPRQPLLPPRACRVPAGDVAPNYDAAWATE